MTRSIQSLTKCRGEVEDLLTFQSEEFSNNKEKFSFFFLEICSATMEWQIVACFIFSSLLWLLICFAMRYTLKLLLIYKGFLTETPGKGISLPTKIWGGLVKGESC
jgi:hypothetical protein